MPTVAELLSYRALDVALIFIDDQAMGTVRRRLIDRIREHFIAVPLVLLATSDCRWPAGSWDTIVSRPQAMTEIAAHLVELAALAVRQPILASA